MVAPSGKVFSEIGGKVRRMSGKDFKLFGESPSVRSSSIITGEQVPVEAVFRTHELTQAYADLEGFRSVHKDQPTVPRTVLGVSPWLRTGGVTGTGTGTFTALSAALKSPCTSKFSTLHCRRRIPYAFWCTCANRGRTPQHACCPARTPFRAGLH